LKYFLSSKIFEQLELALNFSSRGGGRRPRLVRHCLGMLFHSTAKIALRVWHETILFSAPDIVNVCEGLRSTAPKNGVKIDWGKTEVWLWQSQFAYFGALVYR